jgi:hypothetical protein
MAITGFASGGEGSFFWELASEEFCAGPGMNGKTSLAEWANRR